jgi:hypothetical protein
MAGVAVMANEGKDDPFSGIKKEAEQKMAATQAKLDADKAALNAYSAYIVGIMDSEMLHQLGRLQAGNYRPANSDGYITLGKFRFGCFGLWRSAALKVDNKPVPEQEQRHVIGHHLWLRLHRVPERDASPNVFHDHWSEYLVIPAQSGGRWRHWVRSETVTYGAPYEGSIPETRRVNYALHPINGQLRDRFDIYVNELVRQYEGVVLKP